MGVSLQLATAGIRQSCQGVVIGVAKPIGLLDGVGHQAVGPDQRCRRFDLALPRPGQELGNAPEPLPGDGQAVFGQG